MNNNSKNIAGTLSLHKRNTYKAENIDSDGNLHLPFILPHVFCADKYPLKIRKLCGSKRITKNTISLLPMEYITDEDKEDDSVLTAKTAESIKCRGMILPIVVYKVSRNKFKIIDGKRRYHAAKMLDQKYIECLILSSGEETASALELASKINILCSDKLSIFDKKLFRNVTNKSRQMISELTPDIDSAQIMSILLNLPEIEKDELKLLRKIDLFNTLCSIIRINEKSKRKYAEEAAAEMLDDYRSLIDKTISECGTKAQKNEKLVIKNSILLFNSLDSLVKRISNDKLEIVVKKELNPESCEYNLSIRQK